MSDQDQDKKPQKDDAYYILYTTFIMIAVLVLLWGLILLFNQEDGEDVSILDEMNK
jgi:hypothetical protein